MTGRWRSLRALISRPPELALRVGFNGLAQIAPAIVALALTPLLVSRLGLDRFGLWSLALVTVNTLRLVDGGIAASLARFYALHAARDDRRGAGRLLVGSILALAVLGLAFSAAMYPLAPALAEVLKVPARLEAEATVVFRLVPVLAALALIAESTSALLVGSGKFRALALTMWASAAAFAVAVLVLVDRGAHVELVLAATAARHAVLLAGNLVAGARHVSLRRPFLPSLATAREVGSYSWRMQVAAMTGFVNTELDALVIAALLPVRYVGLYQIGLQVASALRSLPLYAFAPLLTRLTTMFRLHGRPAAAAEFEHLDRRWLPAVVGYGMVATAAVGFSVPIWLGDEFALSGAVASILLAGYIAHVALTGMRTCYVRAVGRPGLEMRSSIAWALVNACLTVPMALLFGVVGVVTATAVAGIVASVYFVALCRSEEDLPAVQPDARWWLLAAAGATVTVAGELALVYADVHGFVALALSGVPPVVALASVARGLRPVGRLRIAR
jgi:O-antigen/teichoic acid export membrane protein